MRLSLIGTYDIMGVRVMLMLMLTKSSGRSRGILKPSKDGNQLGNHYVCACTVFK